MSDDKDLHEIVSEQLGKTEVIPGTGDQKKDTGEIRLREIPGLAELEARRKQPKKSSTSAFTLILVILFGFTVVVFLLNKYREDHILATAAEEEAAVVERGRTAGADAKKATAMVGDQKPQAEPAPKKYILTEGDLSGEAPLKVRAKGALVSDEKDPEIAAVGEALRTRVEMLHGIKSRTTNRGGIVTETSSGTFQDFRINSTRIKSDGKITKDEIIVTIPSKGIFIIRDNMLDAWRNCNYETIMQDLINAGIGIDIRRDAVKGIVNVKLSITTLKGIPAANDYLISGRKVGSIELEMTILRMKATLPANYNYVKKRIEYDNEFYNVIKVFDEKKNPLFFVNEQDSKVWGIQIISGKYTTEKGIGIGSTLGRLKIYYPNPKIWSYKGSAPLVSVAGLAGVFVLENEGIDFEKQVFPNNTKIASIVIGGSPYLK
jgi:hypothetical protein